MFLSMASALPRYPGPVFDAKNIESRLKFSIFAHISVESHEYNVSHAAELNYIRPKETVRLIRAGSLDSQGPVRSFLIPSAISSPCPGRSNTSESFSRS